MTKINHAYLIDRNKILAQLITPMETLGIECGMHEVLSLSRRCDIVFARAVVAMWLRNSGYTFTQIGYILNRDHAAIINMLKWEAKKQGIMSGWLEKYEKAKQLQPINKQH